MKNSYIILSLIIVVSLFVFCCTDKKEQNSSIEEDFLYYAGYDLRHFTIQMKKTLSYHDFRYGNSRPKDSVSIMLSDFQVVKYFMGLTNSLFSFDCLMDYNSAIRYISFYGFKNKMKDSIGFNKIYYNQFNYYILHDSIPLREKHHLALLKSLVAISILTPNIDNQPLDSLIIPKYLDKIGHWDFDNILFNNLIFSTNSEVKEISITNSVHDYYALLKRAGNENIHFLNKIKNINLYKLKYLGILSLSNIAVDNLYLEDMEMLEKIDLSTYNCRIINISLKHIQNIEILNFSGKNNEHVILENLPSLKILSFKNNFLDSIKLENLTLARNLVPCFIFNRNLVPMRVGQT